MFLESIVLISNALLCHLKLTIFAQKIYISYSMATSHFELVLKFGLTSGAMVSSSFLMVTD